VRVRSEGSEKRGNARGITATQSGWRGKQVPHQETEEPIREEKGRGTFVASAKKGEEKQNEVRSGEKSQFGVKKKTEPRGKRGRRPGGGDVGVQRKKKKRGKNTWTIRRRGEGG